MTENNNEITQYKENLNPNDLRKLSEYGFDIQEELGRSADSLSNKIKVTDTDEIGQQLVAMQTQMGDIQMGETKATGLPGLFQKYLKKGKLNIIQYQAQRDNVGVSISKITENLNDMSNQLREDCNIATSIAEDAVKYNEKLEAAINDLNDAMNSINSELQTSEDEDRKLQLSRALDIMTRRKNNLMTSQAMASQQYNSMQILIAGNSALIEDMHTAIHTTVPAWRSQLNIAAIVHRQDVGGQIKQAISNTTNQMLKTSAEQLKTSSIRIATEANRPVVDIETIKHVQNEMIETIRTVNETYSRSTATNIQNIKQLEEFKAQNERASKSLGYLEQDVHQIEHR